MKQPLLSIIIPAYQEAARIQPTLEELAEFLKEQSYKDVEVLVVVANGNDKTAELAAAKASLFPRFRVALAGPRAGKGRDVRTGMMEASGRFKLFMDADLATPLHHIATVFSSLPKEPEVIIGVRDLNTTHQGQRKWISNLGNLAVRLLLLPGIKDTQCGFKVFRDDVAEEVFRRQHTLGWGFDMEVLAIARMQGFHIQVLNIPDWHDKPHGTFQPAISSAAFKTLAELIVIIWRRWTGAYRRKTFIYHRYEPHH